MKASDLKQMTEQEVKQIANDLGIEYHHKAGKDKVIAAITEATMEGESDEGDELDEVISVPKHAKRENPAVVQRKEDDRDDSNLPHTAVQKHQPHASVSKEIATPEAAMKALDPFFKRGLLVVEMTPTYWHLRHGKKEASGNMNMPISTLFHEASLLFAPTKIASDSGATV